MEENLQNQSQPVQATPTEQLKPQTTSPVLNSAPQNTKKIRTLFILVGIILLLIIAVGSGYYFLSAKTKQTPVSKTKPTVKKEAAPLQSDSVKLMTNSGLIVAIPKNWGGHFIKNSNSDLLLQLSDWQSNVEDITKTPSNYVQLEIATINKPGQNKYIAVKKTEEVSMGSIKVQKSVGTENFSVKERGFLEYKWTNKGKQYAIKAFSPKIASYEQQIEEFVKNTVSNSAVTGYRTNNFIPKAYAQDEEESKSNPGEDKTAPSSKESQTDPDDKISSINKKFPGLKFTQIQAEAPTANEQFTDGDKKIEEMQTQGFTFTALEGQRLTTIAEEDNSYGYSYIKSNLYDENGTLIKGDLGTRVEFTVPKTGTYYLLVANTKNGTEKYTLRLQDRDQSDIVIKVKRFSDGAELFFPTEEKLTTLPFNDFAFIIYLNKTGDPSLIKPNVFAQAQTKEEFDQKPLFPEESGNQISSVIDLQPNGSLIVAPDAKQLPAGSQIVVSWSTGQNSGYIYRIFTQ